MNYLHNIPVSFTYQGDSFQRAALLLLSLNCFLEIFVLANQLLHLMDRIAELLVL